MQMQALPDRLHAGADSEENPGGGKIARKLSIYIIFFQIKQDKKFFFVRNFVFQGGSRLI